MNSSGRREDAGDHSGRACSGQRGTGGPGGFKHRKHSGIGLAGGDYFKFLSDDSKDVGEDIARFLGAWATGKDLTKD